MFRHACFAFLLASWPVFAQRDWTWRNPLPTGFDLVSAAWDGAAAHVVVAVDGTVLFSADGLAWEPLATSLGADSRQVIWAGGLFVAVGGRHIHTSTDGRVWTPRVSAMAGSLETVTWDGSIYLAAGNDTAVQTSPDGVVWTAQPLEKKVWTLHVIWGGDQFLAVGGSGSIRFSRDGLLWGDRVSNTIETLHWVYRDDSQYVALGTGAMMVSRDGRLWSSGHANHRDGAWRSALWTGSRHFLCGTDLDNEPSTAAAGISVTSGASFGDLETVFDEPVVFASVIRSAAGYLAVGGGGRMASSVDGDTWTPLAAVPYESGFGRVLKFGGAYYAYGVSNVLTSVDGRLWFRVSSNIRCRSTTRFYQAGDSLLLIPEGSTVTTSTDALLSLRIPKQSTVAFEAPVVTDSLMVVMGSFINTHRTMVSTDGAVWEEFPNNLAAKLEGAVWTGEEIVAVSGADLHRSVDGLAWTTEKEPGGSFIVRSGDRYLAGGAGGRLFHSADTRVWENISIPEGENLIDAEWSGSQFVAIGWRGTIYSSLAGTDWKQESSVDGLLGMSVYYDFEFADLLYDNGRFIIVGERGLILTSPEDLTPVATPALRQANASPIRVRALPGGRVAVSLRIPMADVVKVSVLALDGRAVAEAAGDAKGEAILPITGLPRSPAVIRVTMRGHVHNVLFFNP